MGQKSLLTEVKQAQIPILHGKDYTKRKIFERFKCSKTAVYSAYVKYKII